MITRRIVIAGLKGGVGKTNTAIGLASTLTKHGHSVIVGDCDTKNKSARFWARTGVLPFKVASEYQLMSILQKEQFEYLILDTAAAPTDEEIAYLSDGADLLIAPVIPDGINLNSLLEFVRKLPAGTNYRVLIQRSPHPPQTDGESFQVALREKNIPVFDRRIRAFKCYALGSEQGVSAFEVKHDSSGKAWRDWQELSKEFYEVLNDG